MKIGDAQSLTEKRVTRGGYPYGRRGSDNSYNRKSHREIDWTDSDFYDSDDFEFGQYVVELDWGQDDSYQLIDHEDLFRAFARNGYDEDDDSDDYMNFDEEYRSFADFEQFDVDEEDESYFNDFDTFEEEDHSTNTNVETNYWNSYEMEDNTYDSRPPNYANRRTPPISSGRNTASSRVQTK